MKPFDIGKPWIKIANSEVLFEQYRMDLKQYTYGIEVQDYDAIKRNRILFDFVRWTFNCLDGLYLHEKVLLMDTIIEKQSRKQSVSEVKILNRRKKV